MAFSLIETAIILAIGSGAGVMVGIMGGSGVMVVVPMLTLLLSFPVHTAIGTSLLIGQPIFRFEAIGAPQYPVHPVKFPHAEHDVLSAPEP